MTKNIDSIKSLAIDAYCDQFNATSDSDIAITPADCAASITAIDDNSYHIRILNDDCDIDILAILITITDDRFATDNERLAFFLSADHCAYIPLP